MAIKIIFAVDCFRLFRHTYGMDKSQQTKVEFVRTTVRLPRSLYEQAKITAVLTHSNVSLLMRVALQNEIKRIKSKKLKVE